MRYVNYRLSLWFLLLAAVSFIGNMAMGIGFGVSGCRLTRRLRVLVFDKLMRFSMGKQICGIYAALFETMS